MPVCAARALAALARGEAVEQLLVEPLSERGPDAGGQRGRAVARLRGWLAAIERTMPGPAAANRGWRHEAANLLYHLIARLGGGQVEKGWQAHRLHLAQQVLELARRDPGRRIMVVVNLRHCHHLRPALKKHPDVNVVPFAGL
ncbi:MAG: hypothetical protein ACE5G8_15675 [Anaerolineae bacterium]